MMKNSESYSGGGTIGALSLASCNDEFIEGNDFAGSRPRQAGGGEASVRCGTGITTTITTRAAGGEIDYDSQLSGVMAFV